MKIALATNHLGLGGSESYLLTVAEQLDRLGHEAVVFTLEPGEGVEAARERGIEVVGEDDLAREVDVALVQDAAVSYRLADLHPDVPHLFVAHSGKFDLQAPPQLPGMVGAVVTLNDRVAERMRGFATEAELVRLRQPIDIDRFSPRDALPPTPRRALLLSHNGNGDRVAMLEGACAEAGLELTRVGGLAGHAADIRPALAGAEIVIGYGRSVLEAMACGRAAYVYDWRGGDGWVTADSYATIESDGFAGSGRDGAVGREALVADLRAYAPSMGPVNHDLVVQHHRASVHAQQLLELLRRLAPPRERPRAQLEEMARLVRLEWRARIDGNALVQENAHLRRLLEASEAERARLESAAERAQRQAEGTAAEYEATTSWRLTRPLRALGGALRRRRGGSSAE